MAWLGFVQYFQSNGTGDDFWGSHNKWFENNATRLNYRNITIFEPCNFASNVAIYRAANEVMSQTQN